MITAEIIKNCAYQKKFSGSYYTTALRCVENCDRFPCESFTPEEIKRIEESGEIVEEPVALIKRRKKMYLFKKSNGNVEQAYNGFDPSNPDWSKMQEVQEVLYVSKVYVPQMKLVVKKPEEAAATTTTKGKAKKG